MFVVSGHGWEGGDAFSAEKGNVRSFDTDFFATLSASGCLTNVHLDLSDINGFTHLLMFAHKMAGPNEQIVNSTILDIILS